MTRTYLLTSLFALSSAFCHGQTFLNGSFESTTSTGCDYNLTNDDFNSAMDNVSAFGTGGEVDVMEIDCIITSVPDGIKAIAIGTQELGEIDAISLELSEVLISDNDYTISFIAYGTTDFTLSLQTLIIGCSTIDNDFSAEDLYSADLIDSEWIEVSFTFTAPNDAKYITVKPVSEFSSSWTVLDDFKIAPSFASISEGNVTSSVKTYPNPSKDFIQVAGIEENLGYLIYNSLGIEIGSGVTTENEMIDVQNLSKGIYLLKLDNGLSTKFIKE